MEKESFYGAHTTIMHWRLATHASLKSLAAHTQKTKQNKKKNLFDVNVFTKTILHGKLHFYSLDEKNWLLIKIFGFKAVEYLIIQGFRTSQKFQTSENSTN